jgi:hypothetical protein
MERGKGKMKFETVAVSFTLKGQDFSKIKDKLKEIAEKHKDSKVELVHGHMPRHKVLEAGFGTELVDALDELFHMQAVFFGYREDMVNYVSRANGTVYFIGEIVDGVKEEYDLYSETLHPGRIVKMDL